MFKQQSIYGISAKTSSRCREVDFVEIVCITFNSLWDKLRCVRTLSLLIIWLSPRAGGMKRIPHSDWQPERWYSIPRYFSKMLARDFLRWSGKENFTFCPCNNSTLFGQGGWILTSFFFAFLLTLSWVYQNAKRTSANRDLKITQRRRQWERHKKQQV